MTYPTESAPRARIAVFEFAGARLDEWVHACGQFHYGAEDGLRASASDVTIFDLRDVETAPRNLSAIAETARRQSPEAPIISVLSPDCGQPLRAAARKLGDVIPASDDLTHIGQRLRSVIRLRNVAEETGERLKSLAALNCLAAYPMIATEETPFRALIAGAPGAPAIVAHNALTAAKFSTVSVLSASQAMRALDHDEFDCVVFFPSSENDPLVGLSNTLRRGSHLGAVATLRIAPDVAALERAGRETGGDTVLIDEIAAECGRKARNAARRARLMRAMRPFLEACHGDGVCDAVSGAFSSTFLSAHGARLCGRADQTERPLSYILATLTAQRAGRCSTPGRFALRRLGQAIKQTVRIEDCVARIARDRFLILMPATNEAGAQAAAQRLEGVIAHTPYQESEAGLPYRAHATVTVGARARGASIEECVADALRRSQQSTLTLREQFPQ
ncbi:MAG: diguanylate cyclase [Pseudomonadota bacterium]